MTFIIIIIIIHRHLLLHHLMMKVFFYMQQRRSIPAKSSHKFNIPIITCLKRHHQHHHTLETVEARTPEPRTKPTMKATTTSSEHPQQHRHQLPHQRCPGLSLSALLSPNTMMCKRCCDQLQTSSCGILQQVPTRDCKRWNTAWGNRFYSSFSSNAHRSHFENSNAKRHNKWKFCNKSHQKLSMTWLGIVLFPTLRSTMSP